MVKFVFNVASLISFSGKIFLLPVQLSYSIFIYTYFHHLPSVICKNWLFADAKKNDKIKKTNPLMPFLGY